MEASLCGKIDKTRIMEEKKIIVESGKKLVYNKIRDERKSERKDK